MKQVETPVGPLLCWGEDDVTRSLETGAFWDEHIKQAIDETPTDGWAIDIGANIGFFSIYLARKFERVIAIEAHPGTAYLLLQNLELNQISNVLVVAGAAYDTHRQLEIAKQGVHGWPEAAKDLPPTNLDQHPHVAGFSFVETGPLQDERHQLSIPTVLIDDLIPDGVKVRLMKIDCQGAALRAMEGARRVLRESRPRIIFEYESPVSQCRGDDWPDYVWFLDAMDYDLITLPGPWSEHLAVPR